MSFIFTSLRWGFNICRWIHFCNVLEVGWVEKDLEHLKGRLPLLPLSQVVFAFKLKLKFTTSWINSNVEVWGFNHALYDTGLWTNLFGTRLILIFTTSFLNCIGLTLSKVEVWKFNHRLYDTGPWSNRLCQHKWCQSALCMEHFTWNTQSVELANNSFLIRKGKEKYVWNYWHTVQNADLDSGDQNLVLI